MFMGTHAHGIEVGNSAGMNECFPHPKILLLKWMNVWIIIWKKEISTYVYYDTISTYCIIIRDLQRSQCKLKCTNFQIFFEPLNIQIKTSYEGSVKQNICLKLRT